MTPAESPPHSPADRNAARGIYFLADDRVIEHAIALLGSIRAVDGETPIVMIPYDDDHHRIAEIACRHFGATLYDDAATLDWIDACARRHVGADALRGRGRLRKWACWFGPFEEFLYVDCDVVVLERVTGLFEYLQAADFVTCDDQFERGLKHVFTEAALDDAVFPAAELANVFDTGLFVSHAALFGRARVEACFAAAGKQRRYLDFSRGCDQPLLNFALLHTTRKRLNLYRELPGEPAMRAGSPNLFSSGTGIVDRRNGRIPRFVHWTGTPIGPGGAHWELWRHYRELDPDLPPPHLAPVRLGPWHGLRRRALSLQRRARRLLAPTMRGN